MRLHDHNTIPCCTCGRPLASLHRNQQGGHFLLVALRDVTYSPGGLVRGQCKQCDKYASFDAEVAMRQAIAAQSRPVATGRTVCLT